jgi:surface protein
MSGMFEEAKLFNQNLRTNGLKWNTSNVVYMTNMFYKAYAFNGDISNWNTSNVTDMSDMFNSAQSFNRDISNWDTSNADITDMFADATNMEEHNKPTFR